MEFPIVLFWLACGIGAAMVASSKGRSGCGWFAGGVLFGPLALLVVGFMPSAVQSSSGTTELSQFAYKEREIRVKCPYCAELIMPEALICRFCGREVKTAISEDARLLAGNTPAAATSFRTCLRCGTWSSKGATVCGQCGAKFSLLE